MLLETLYTRKNDNIKIYQIKIDKDIKIKNPNGLEVHYDIYSIINLHGNLNEPLIENKIIIGESYKRALNIARASWQRKKSEGYYTLSDLTIMIDSEKDYDNQLKTKLNLNLPKF